MSENIHQIPLDKGYVAIVDYLDFERLKNYKWHTKAHSGVIYAARSAPRKEGHKTIYMHRQILNMDNTGTVHHVNHNTLDNRRVNLEILDQSENSREASYRRWKQMPMIYKP